MEHSLIRLCAYGAFAFLAPCSTYAAKASGSPADSSRASAALKSAADPADFVREMRCGFASRSKQRGLAPILTPSLF